MSRRAWPLLCGVAVALSSTGAWADMFSPGDLAKAHHQLEGLSNCTQCHPAGQQLSQGSCLACHTELKPQIAKGAGFHGRIASAERNCERCHHEHQGLSAPLIQWGDNGKRGFNHTRTGWALHGAHLKLDCAKCHQPKRINSAPILQLIEKTGRSETFLGLPDSCQSCHFDEHRGQVGQQCEGCHTEKEWEPAPGFSHDQTEYALTGKHARVACEKCHPKQRDDSTPKNAFPAPVNETFLKYSPIEHKSCLDCHKDVHEGRFGPRCASCHTTQGWRVIRNADQERAFHEKARFPLKGEHVDAPCVSCHGPWPGQPAKFKGLKFDNCIDCHPDGHQGQLTATKGKSPDCQSCHAVEGFQPVRFSLEQHQKTRYPLEGAHATVGCLLCHPRTDSLIDKVPVAVRLDLKRKKRPELFSVAMLDFKAPLDRCDSCHADAHQGQFKDKPCEKCHQEASFKKLTFDHDTDSSYPLEGAHAKVACEKCHAPEKKGKAVQYRGLPGDCAGCHADAHAGQLAEVKGAATKCERCHDTKDFHRTRFKHQPPFTAYLLEGAHQKVACEKCHPKVKVTANVEVSRYKPLPTACESCHSDFHQGAFKGFEP